MNSFIFAQFFAFSSSLCLLISFWQKKRKNILFFQMLDSFFDIIQYFLLGAYTGCVISFLGTTRAYCFSKKNNIIYLYLFLILYILVSIFTFNGIKSLIPLMAALIYTLVVWNKKEKNIRLFSVFVFVLWFIYDILVKAYISCITDIVLVISNYIAFCKLDKS